MAGTAQGYRPGLVDLDKGQISREIFVSEAVCRADGSERGRGFEIEHYEWPGLHLPGTVMDITEAKSSEHNLRNFYRRWAAFMEAESWDELAAGRRAAE